MFPATGMEQKRIWRTVYVSVQAEGERDREINRMLG